jgi:SAM-dependent methyltransferase
MSEVFGSVYADSYDALYQDKDYRAECDLITQLFQKYGQRPVRQILDLGCGTGNHAFPLAQQGYEVVGVERSESMLARARAKAAKSAAENRVLFQQGDIRSVELGRLFDAALIMFAVLGYQHENADVRATLRTARRHLRPGGLLVFDVWYGPAVLRERPSQRVKVIPTHEGKILRVASGTLDTLRNLCRTDYLLWRWGDGKPVQETNESHTMRYFFAPELDLFLQGEGFALDRLGAFPEFQRDPDETTWNVLGAAHAVGDADL